MSLLNDQRRREESKSKHQIAKILATAHDTDALSELILRLKILHASGYTLEQKDCFRPFVFREIAKLLDRAFSKIEEKDPNILATMSKLLERLSDLSIDFQYPFEDETIDLLRTAAENEVLRQELGQTEKGSVWVI